VSDLQLLRELQRVINLDAECGAARTFGPLQWKMPTRFGCAALASSTSASSRAASPLRLVAWLTVMPAYATTSFIDTLMSASFALFTGLRLRMSILPIMNSGGALIASTD
jgi:hypothetical protein